MYKEERETKKGRRRRRREFRYVFFGPKKGPLFVCCG